jgi:hypothetical protein
MEYSRDQGGKENKEWELKEQLGRHWQSLKRNDGNIV